ncbi:MAG TPA: hypothetical protein VNF99_02375 [Stellaceae bacterium]|nr:hypothetical protein [Stellaceae bacterium]
MTVLWRKLHAQAMVQHVFPQLFTQAEGGAMKAEILREIERVQHTLTVRLFGMLLGFTALAIPVAKAL